MDNYLKTSDANCDVMLIFELARLTPRTVRHIIPHPTHKKHPLPPQLLRSPAVKPYYRSNLAGLLLH